MKIGVEVKKLFVWKWVELVLKGRQPLPGDWLKVSTLVARKESESSYS